MIHKIVIASTLKPVDDVRAFKKIAQSLAKTNKYEINIIGNKRKKESTFSGVHFHSHFLRSDNFLNRQIMVWKVFLKIFRLKPHLLIITTHELLLPAALIKVLLRAKLIYDVQEDYKKNLIHLRSSYRSIMKIAGHLVRAKEKIFSPFIDQFWLAEETYQNDLSFLHKSSIILENKSKDISFPKERYGEFSVLFSGTVSHYSQVLLAVKTYQELSKTLDTDSLTIIGQYHDYALKKQLEELAREDRSIILKISKEPVPHDEILQHIFSSQLGIISYQENEVNSKKVPTKLYEYSRYRLPYLIQKETLWEKKSRVLGGGIVVDFKQIKVEKIINKLKEPEELFKDPYPEKETWESQESLIQSSIDHLMNRTK